MSEKILQGPLKRVAAIHDISGFGKCSLTVALPIISAAGVETCCFPTAVLSTHTGGFEGYTFRDLTEDMPAFTDHWHSLDLKFQAVYTGFLGSSEQADHVVDFIDKFNSDDTLICVDPAMADNGELYKIFDDSMVSAQREICKKADVIIPNFTEAALILEEPYQAGPYTEAYVEHILKALADLGPKKVVLTGVYFEEGQLGAATYDAVEEKICYAFAPKIPGQYHGTGDVFGSFLIAGLMNELSLADSSQLAVDLTQQAIARTAQRRTPNREGVDFEGVLPELIRRLEL